MFDKNILDKKFVFNINYKIRTDINRIIISSNYSKFKTPFDKEQEQLTKSFVWFLHPSMAVVLNYFDGAGTLREVITTLANDMDMTFEEAEKSIEKFVENKEIVYYPIRQMKLHLALPKNVIVENVNNITRNDILQGIDIDYITEHFDISVKRLNIPEGLTLMPNSNCHTRCIYCYVDKKKEIKQLLPVYRIKEIIKEARQLGINDCQITGGDLFSYPFWEEILTCLDENDYRPYLSTKVPIDEPIIQKLKQLGFKKIQISLDSINPDTLTKILHVDNTYIKKMKKTLKLLQQYNLIFCVKSVVTKYNDSIEEMKNLIDFLSQFENLEYHTIAPGEYSLYSDFNAFRTTSTKMDAIKTYVKALQNPKFLSQDYAEKITNTSFEEKKINFDHRAACSGNISGFLVLPDGQVTLCEQTYWTPQLLIGDMNRQSIMEMWNSEEALALWNFSQEDCQDTNPCKTCSEFETCRRGKGVCWRMACASYGIENYDFPVAECPYSLPVTNDIYI